MAKVVTGKVRLVYLSLKEKSAPPNSDRQRYNVCMLIDTEDKYTMGKLEEAYSNCAAEGKKSCKGWKGKIPREVKNFEDSLRDLYDDGDGPDWAEGYLALSPKTDYYVAVIDRNKKIVDYDDCYNGMYARVSLSPYYYSHDSGGKGIAWNLNSIQKLTGGELIEMQHTPGADFDNEEDDYEYDEDDTIYEDNLI